VAEVASPVRWGSVRDAAERRGLSVPTIRRYITQGLIRAERVGPKLIRVDLDSVDNLGTPLQYIERVVGEAPALTGGQRDRLAAILRGAS
jgi:excisionase family DNA binding protein